MNLIHYIDGYNEVWKLNLFTPIIIKEEKSGSEFLIKMKYISMISVAVSI